MICFAPWDSGCAQCTDLRPAAALRFQHGVVSSTSRDTARVCTQGRQSHGQGPAPAPHMATVWSMWAGVTQSTKRSCCPQPSSCSVHSCWHQETAESTVSKNPAQQCSQPRRDAVGQHTHPPPRNLSAQALLPGQRPTPQPAGRPLTSAGYQEEDTVSEPRARRTQGEGGCLHRSPQHLALECRQGPPEAHTLPSQGSQEINYRLNLFLVDKVLRPHIWGQGSLKDS